jgi:hypothetical protein
MGQYSKHWKFTTFFLASQAITLELKAEHSALIAECEALGKETEAIRRETEVLMKGKMIFGASEASILSV